MLTFHNKYAEDVYSQNGEDGVVREILLRLGIEKGVVVEFGAHDGTFCSNSRHLIEKGWKAFLIEADNDLFEKCVRLHSDNGRVFIGYSFINPHNVNDILPNTCDVLSIDVDGIDYDIWDAYQGDAKVVIIEINSSLEPTSELMGDPERGSSFRSMIELGYAKGYIPICHCGNIIFVQGKYRDLFPEIPEYCIIAEYFNRSWL